jgi:anti-anti-sigma regulatory factor
MQGLAQFPPLQPDARYVTLLSARVVDHLERQYEAQRVRLRSEPDTAPQTIAADQQIDTALLPLFSGKYLLLLLGNLDQSRLEAIAAKILPDMLNFKASHLFIDMSKLGEMSPDAAIRLVRLVRELNVCGVRASLSGLTPMVASVFVAQNLDTLGIATYRSLDEAIAGS